MGFRFDDVIVEPSEYRVSKHGEAVMLEPKAFQVLIFLLERRGRLVSKDEILDAVWEDAFVTPNALTRAVAQIRRALGDGSRNSRYIETVPTRGYRFVADVLETQLGDQHLSAQSPGDTTLGTPIFNEISHTSFRPVVANRGGGLARLIAIVLFAVAIAGVTYFLFIRNSYKPETTSGVSEETIAVLPFKLIDGNDESTYLSLGLADSLITKLSNVRGLTVRPTASVSRYLTSEIDPATAGRDLNVSSVITGGVQRDNDRVRVSVQMVRVADGKPIWAESYDTRFGDIFQVQDEISTRITDALQIRLSVEERTRVAHPPTNNIDAYQSFLEANAKLAKVSPDNLKAAIEKFNAAIAIDPAYALAYAKLANAYGLAASYDIPSAKELAEKNALRAIELDPNLAEAHTSMAVLQFWSYHNVAKGQDSFVHSLELNPNSSYTHLYYGWFLVANGYFDEAERHLRRALDLDPSSQSNIADQGLPFYYSHRFEEARRLYQHSLEVNEKFWYGHARLAEACEALGDANCAVTEIKRAAELSPQDTALRCELVRMLVLAGKRNEAGHLLLEVTSSNAPRVRPYFVALAEAALGEKDQVFAALERCLDEKDSWLAWIKVDPRFDEFRDDPRFEELLIRINLK